MKMKPTTLFLVIILLLMVLTGGMALNFGHVEATLAPLLVSGCIFVLAIAELIREAKSKRQGPPRPADEEEVSLTVVETAKGKGEAPPVRQGPWLDRWICPGHHCCRVFSGGIALRLHLSQGAGAFLGFVGSFRRLFHRGNLPDLCRRLQGEPLFRARLPRLNKGSREIGKIDR